MNEVRIHVALARAGVASRRVCEDHVADGRVTINGREATIGDKVDVVYDEVRLDGALIPLDPALVYYLLHKPAGYVTTASDPQGRPTVVELVPAEPRVFPVGRLDLDSEGLLILTNDGPLTHQLTHPSFGVEKEYLAAVEGVPARGALRRLREGVELDDGVTAPAKVAALDGGLLRITIHEGRNRQVRRMCEAIGHPVTRLIRVRIGSLRDESLAPAQWRVLTADEVRSLARSAAAGTAPDVAPDRSG